MYELGAVKPHMRLLYAGAQLCGTADASAAPEVLT